MSLKEFLTKKFFFYVFLRITTIILMVLALFYLYFSSDTNIILSLVLFVLSLVFMIITQKIKKPKLTTCLDKSNFFVLLIVPTITYIGLGMLALGFVNGFENILINKQHFLFFAILLIFFGVAVYLFCCKKNKILD